MIILGIETSCDETAASIVENGERLLSSVIHSQIDIHSTYGGVIPEIAARSHIEYINPVINKALHDANLKLENIDAIAITNAPGLIGSLLVGNMAAKTIAITKEIPLFPVHHVEAHVYANFITKQAGHLKLELPHSQPKFPLLALIVSGGHSQLVLFEDHGQYEILGQTQDDAVGEAFDKVAKILGLPYPGGPSISQAALNGDANKYKLPIAKMKNPYDFSFSGLKTAVLRAVQAKVGVDYTFPSHQLHERLDDVTRNDFAASFQKTAVETLVKATLAAYKKYSPASVVIAGGVAANLELRRQLREKLPVDIEYAPTQLCTDNAAMVATLGYYHSQYIAATEPNQLEVIPSLSMNDSRWR